MGSYELGFRLDLLHDRPHRRIVLPGGGHQQVTRELGGLPRSGRLVDVVPFILGQPEGEHAEFLARGLGLGGRIDVCDDCSIGMGILHRLEALDIHHVGHGAFRIDVGEDDPLSRGEDLGRFRHEPDTAENDVLAFQLSRLHGKVE